MTCLHACVLFGWWCCCCQCAFGFLLDRLLVAQKQQQQKQQQSLHPCGLNGEWRCISAANILRGIGTPIQSVVLSSNANRLQMETGDLIESIQDVVVAPLRARPDMFIPFEPLTSLVENQLYGIFRPLASHVNGPLMQRRGMVWNQQIKPTLELVDPPSHPPGANGYSDDGSNSMSSSALNVPATAVPDAYKIPIGGPKNADGMWLYLYVQGLDASLDGIYAHAGNKIYHRIYSSRRKSSIHTHTEQEGTPATLHAVHDGIAVASQDSQTIGFAKSKDETKFCHRQQLQRREDGSMINCVLTSDLLEWTLITPTGQSMAPNSVVIFPTDFQLFLDANQFVQSAATEPA